MSHIAGPVPLKSEAYVERRFETEACNVLLRREWILLLGPRQHGKTSALIRIQMKLREAGFRCCFIDLQLVPPGLTFPELLAWFAAGVARSLGHRLTEPTQWDRDSLEAWLNCAIAAGGAPTVILIDEASGVLDEQMRNAFFGQIRALKSAGAVAEQGSIIGALQFLFSGTFRPETLVDERNSPFNVCRRIETDDLGREDVFRLARAEFGREQVDEVVDSILSSVGGQPHLIQSLLAVASGRDAEDQVSAITAQVDEWVAGGSDHLASIFQAVMQDRTLVQIVATAVTQGSVANDAANADYKFLTVLGLLRREGERLVFRNRLYERVAQASTQLRPEIGLQRAMNAHFYNLPEGAFAFVGDVQYREICFAAYNGAVVAHNSGSFRLALVGFGISLEAILIDRLLREPPADLVAAIARSGGDVRFNQHEVQADPSTWRLVNLMKVCRLLNRVRGVLDLPESLREMRNYVHPKLIKENYFAEPAMAPEAGGAGNLLAMVMRDIQLP